MDFSLIILEIKKRVDFYQKSYDTDFWKLSDESLNKFLVTNYINYFCNKNEKIFYRAMLEFTDSIIMDAMSDNRIIINEDYICRNIYLIRFINVEECTDFPKYEDEIKRQLKGIYELSQKKLTKKI